MYWTRTTDESYTGAHSIKTPNLSRNEGIAGDGKSQSANVTLHIQDEWTLPGTLRFAYLNRFNLPSDAVSVFVDDQRKMRVDMQSRDEDWEVYEIGIELGSRVVTWAYDYNPTEEENDLSALNDGQFFVDNVYFIPLAQTGLPSRSPSPTNVVCNPSSPVFHLLNLFD